MSSRHLLVLTALTSFFLVGATAAQAPRADSIADLLLKDQIDAVEARLTSSPNTADTVAFRGEVEYRKGHFDQASELYRSALQLNEKTARAHFGLGKLALARLKIADANRYFARAIELDPKEPLFRFYFSEALMLGKKTKEADRQLQEYLKLNPADPDRVPMARAILDISNAFEGAELGQIEAPNQPSPIRLQRMMNFFFAEVMINGQGPYRFLVDTGATQTVLSEKVSATLGLKKIATNLMYGVGGEGKLESSVYRADSLKIGDVTVRNVPVGTLSNPLLALVMDGILGPSLLSDFVITIDYPSSQIELSRNTLPSPSGRGWPEGPGEAIGTGAVVPVWCFSGLLLTGVEVNDKYKGNFLIDTGADVTLLAYSMANNLGVTKDTPGASLNIPIGGIGGLDDGVLVVQSVNLKTPFESKHFDTMMAIELRAMSSLIQTELSGVLGYDALKDYRVTLDYQKAEVRLSK
jgi:predicted aspartyl protease